jgi:hypothetical protein
MRRVVLPMPPLPTGGLVTSAQPVGHTPDTWLQRSACAHAAVQCTACQHAAVQCAPTCLQALPFIPTHTHLRTSWCVVSTARGAVPELRQHTCACCHAMCHPPQPHALPCILTHTAYETSGCVVSCSKTTSRSSSLICLLSFSSANWTPEHTAQHSARFTGAQHRASGSHCF